MKKKKILLIDDQAGFTNFVKMYLEFNDKYEVRTENKGANGLAAAKEYKPDIILLDIAMPDMNGSKVLQQLKADVVTKDIPVVFITALIKKEELTHLGGTIDGQPFLVKPVGRKAFIECIEKYTSLSNDKSRNLISLGKSIFR